jgi:hypothetical protein
LTIPWSIVNQGGVNVGLCSANWLAGAASGLRRARNLTMTPDSSMWLRRWLPTARLELHADVAWTDGEGLSLEEAVKYATSDSVTLGCVEPIA